METVSDAPSLPNWIAYVFDHPVADPAWDDSVDAPWWEDSPEHITTLIAETFERSGELLARFSDEQLNQGFWFLMSGGGSSVMHTLLDPEVPVPVSLRALRSFVPLFEQVMAVRCPPHLSHLDRWKGVRLCDRSTTINDIPSGASALNSACYIWWDSLPIYGRPDDPDRAEFDSEVLVVLRRFLAIPHDACRESALHGLGHWRLYYPQVADIVDEFLRETHDLRPELIAYAQRARTGYVL